MNESHSTGYDIFTICSFVVAVITLIFGRNILGLIRDRKACESDNFCKVAEEYLSLIEKLHEHALKHQSGKISDDLTCNQSADIFGDMSKKVGMLRKRLEDLFMEEEIPPDLEVLHLRWKDAIFTDRGLMTKKSSKSAPSEIIKMDDTKEKLLAFLNILIVRSKKRKLNLKAL